MLLRLRAPLRLGVLLLLLSGLAAAEPGALANSLSEFVFGYSKAVNAVALSPDGRQAASASQDDLLRLWDLPTGLLLRTFDAQTSGINSVAFSPDGRRILTGGSDNRLRIWDIAAGQAVTVMEGHTGEVLSAAFSPNGLQALSGSKDKTVKLWDAADRPPPQELSRATPKTCFRWRSPPMAGWLSRGVRTRRSNSGTSRPASSSRPSRAMPMRSTSAAFSPDSQRALSASKDKTVKLWDVAAGKLLKDIRGAFGRGAFGPVRARRPANPLRKQGQDAEALGRGDRRAAQNLRRACGRGCLGGVLARRPAGALRQQGQNAKTLGCGGGPAQKHVRPASGSFRAQRPAHLRIFRLHSRRVAAECTRCCAPERAPAAERLQARRSGLSAHLQGRRGSRDMDQARAALRAVLHLSNLRLVGPARAETADMATISRRKASTLSAKASSIRTAITIARSIWDIPICSMPRTAGRATR